MEHERNLVIQPFSMEILPIKKLCVFNFEKDTDEIYKGLELQYLETNNGVKGYWLIAYRHDEYVDVYDEKALNMELEGKFEVCGKGLKHYRKTSLGNPCFKLMQEGIRINFSLNDYKGRKIEVEIKERAKKKSRPFDLIAPVGVSSDKPVALPVFAMYQFDLIRKRNTEVTINIGGKKITLDSFPVPVPKDGQMRYFARYGYDCELVQFGRAKEEIIKPEECLNNQLSQKGLVARYELKEGMYGMKTLEMEKSKHHCRLYFEDAFPDIMRMEAKRAHGRFYIEMDEGMGYFSGEYCVEKKGEIVEIEMEPSKGWIVKHKMLFTKIIFNKKSVFRTWPQTYRYLQRIDLKTGQSTCRWIRLKKDTKRSM